MSAISSIGSSNSSIGETQFLQLLIAELKNQDPSDPVSPTQSVTQLAQFSSLEGIQSLGASFDQMLQLQQLSSGTNLVGKDIQYTDSSGNAQSGKVNQLTVNQGNVFLTVGSNQVPLSNVTGVLSS